ncbi:DUF1552 domain-containing protein [Roseiconus nitratireducens]|uniref:DUF1552 domain-containing protein n=1 Tax=Roseiconus nitratireducens TaxID=2605748 RepID=A0A5M6DH96_9BACT|nr:DUF1552 domain-containing protein [Roseiconus nitratireducens]KAA5544635.1 DUF1552 domain-containing protein [Roseiconus nitratireducens]
MNLNDLTLDRRTILRGVSAALGLPLLEAMTPMARSAFASADAVKRPVRMACVFVPNGVIVPKWRPTGSERDWQLSETLQPLSPVKEKVNVISNLTLDNGRGYKDGAGDHARCGATFLTAARPLKTSSNIRLGVSVDQVAASQLAGQTRLPSIELGLLGSRNAGSCDSGYSCAYSSNISWRNETQPMPKETVPRLAFERMFGGENAAARRETNRTRQSILDVVRGDAQRLMKQLGKNDRRKMDEYFTGVREIESRIERIEQEDATAMPDLDVPYGRVEAFREHARLMFDLMVVGFQTDTTRVATLMLDNAGGNRRYTEIGIKDSHHGMSHHRDKPELVGNLQKIDRYLVEQFSYFLQKLDATEDAGGSLLDQSMVLYGSGISDGNRHRHEDLPIVLAGSASGQIETGRFIDAGDECPMANLFLSMLDLMGTPAESIGDSSGRLDKLA